MSDIIFKPIFNQSEFCVWDNFIDIGAASRLGTYGIVTLNDKYLYKMDEYKNNWKRRSFNFAFGAYDKSQMVGFIHGYCADRVGYIEELYILPEYQGQRIGSRLLTMGETAITYGAGKIELTALATRRAMSYYPKRGYTIRLAPNGFEKKLAKRPCCQTVPVFKVTRPIAKACAQIASVHGDTFDAAQINSSHAPMFIYVNVQSEITGFGLAGGDNGNIKTYVAPHNDVDWIRKRLIKSFAELSK